MSAATAAAPRSTRRGGLRLDPVLIGVVMSILLLGLVMVASASTPIAAQKGGDPFRFLKDQFLMAVAGTGLAALLCAIPTELYQKFANLLLVAAAVLLVAVFIPGIGHASHGAHRWLLLGGVQVQTSEIARVMVLCWVAAYAVRREQALRETFAGLVVPLVVTCVFSALLVLEPDFGAASVLFATAFGLLFLAGARLRWVLVCMAIGAAVFAAVMVVEPYRWARLLCSFNPWAHADDCGYQAVNAQIAIGRGEWFGVGLGSSVQKLFYLPEAHNDFLFAVLAEELGLLGVLVTLGLFLVLVWRVLRLARQAADAGLRFQAYMAGSFALWVGMQAMINMGVNLGLPTKGLTLPFMSYGRSSLLATLVWFGMILRINHEVVVRSRGSASGSRGEIAGAEA